MKTAPRSRVSKTDKSLTKTGTAPCKCKKKGVLPSDAVYPGTGCRHSCPESLGALVNEELQGSMKGSSPSPSISCPFKFIDLFSGIGGLRIPFDELGGKCVFSCENDPYAVKTYNAMFGESPLRDIREVEAKDVPEHDVLVAGFPCQPFSLAGVSKYNSLGWGHGFEHATKGTLFFHIAKILSYHKPKAFLLENVKNLRSHDGGKTFSVIMRTLQDELGYKTVEATVIDARALVPQHRERIFIVGFKEKTDFLFPELPDGNPKLKEILDPSPDPKYTLSDKLWTYLQRYAEKHRALGNGFGYGLANLEGISRTLSARYYKDGSEILIPQEGKNPRRLTPAECARLMGFPPRYEKLPVCDTQAYKQFGNAVVVPVVRLVACAILEKLRELDATFENTPLSVEKTSILIQL